MMATLFYVSLVTPGNTFCAITTALSLYRRTTRAEIVIHDNMNLIPRMRPINSFDKGGKETAIGETGPLHLIRLASLLHLGVYHVSVLRSGKTNILSFIKSEQWGKTSVAEKTMT